MSISHVTEKRLKQELKDLIKNKLEFAQAIQDDTNRFVFYFLLKGDKDTDYKNGYYIGKIMLPESYPLKPGDFMMLTPSGRFTTNSKICLTNSGYHASNWTPIWSIRNMMIGFSSIFHSDNEHGISHINDTSMNKKKMANESVTFNMIYYKDIFLRFNQFINDDGTIKNVDNIPANKINPSDTHKTEFVDISKNIQSEKPEIFYNCAEKNKHTDLKKEIISDKYNNTECNTVNENLEGIEKMTLNTFHIDQFNMIHDILYKHIRYDMIHA